MWARSVPVRPARGGLIAEWLVGGDRRRIALDAERADFAGEIAGQRQAEHYISEESCRQIADAFKPDKIILFGSRADGKPRLNSDVDLLVIMPYEGSSREQASKIRRHLDKLVSMDLLVRTADEVRERIAIEDDFIQQIIEHGKVMYEANHS